MQKNKNQSIILFTVFISASIIAQPHYVTFNTCIAAPAEKQYVMSYIF